MPLASRFFSFISSLTRHLLIYWTPLAGSSVTLPPVLKSQSWASTPGSPESLMSGWGQWSWRKLLVWATGTEKREQQPRATLWCHHLGPPCGSAESEKARVPASGSPELEVCQTPLQQFPGIYKQTIALYSQPKVYAIVGKKMKRIK
jgi:hypothetical protein